MKLHLEGSLSTLQKVWPDLKLLYRDILKKAYKKEQQREAAHDVLLRLNGSLIDFYLTDSARFAPFFTLCQKENQHPKGEYGDSDEDSGEEERVNISFDYDSNREHKQSSSLNDMETPPSLGLTTDELQQMFSFISPMMLGLLPNQGERQHDVWNVHQDQGQNEADEKAVEEDEEDEDDDEAQEDENEDDEAY